MPNTIVITGANRGIGLALVNAFSMRGDKVIAVCRRSSSTLEALGVDVISGIESTEQKSLDLLKSRLGDQKIDVLINNAGILSSEELGSIDYDAVRRQFEVNALAPLRITEILLSNLYEDSKVVMITSRMASVADNSSGAYYGYRMSKTALNCAAVSLARDLEPRKIAVCLLHPGFVQTEMVNLAGEVSADEAALNLLNRIDGLTLEDTGSFWHANGQLLPW